MCLDLFQVPVRADGLNVETIGSTLDGESVKGENMENILAEESDGMCCILCFVFNCLCACLSVIKKNLSLCSRKGK